MNAVKRHLDDFFSLFFPELCACCGTNLVSNESVICSDCVYHLPYTDFHLIKDNSVARQFWGRLPIIEGGAFLHFSKGSRVQNLLHQLKYNNKPEVGFKLGQMYGRILNDHVDYQKPDLIIPVPLHPARKKKRGYNQSEYFAEGLSSALNIPTSPSILTRTIYTDTQTRKSRFVRHENMKDVFEANNKEELQDRHLLLVDDIITTGATLENCALAIRKIAEVKFSIAGIAFTD